MYIDARYHIASLAAVLIAVGIGLLVGVGLNGGERLPELTKKVYQDKIARLDSDLKAERRDREKQAKELEIAQQDAQAFGKDLLPLLLDGRLKGQRVVIFSLSDKADGIVDARRAIEVAGGEVMATVSLSGMPRPLDSKTVSAMAKDFGIAPADRESQPDSPAEMMTMLTKALTLGVYTKGLDALETRGWVTVEGSLGRTTMSTVIVVIGGNSVDQTKNTMESLFLKALVQRGRRVVGAERSDAGFSSMGNMRSALTATVDNVERPAGKISLVFCIEGVDGHFGARDSAEALMPDRIPQ